MHHNHNCRITTKHPWLDMRNWLLWTYMAMKATTHPNMWYDGKFLIQWFNCEDHWALSILLYSLSHHGIQYSLSHSAIPWWISTLDQGNFCCVALCNYTPLSTMSYKHIGCSGTFFSPCCTVSNTLNMLRQVVPLGQHPQLPTKKPPSVA